MDSNERLRDALMRAQLDQVDFAREIDVDVKTVERWITQGRVPYPKTRAKVSAVLGQSQTYLWPQAFSDDQKVELSDSEVHRVYRRRSQIEDESWARLIEGASERIDILVLAGLFLPEQQLKLADTFCAKAAEGARVRLLFGNPDGGEVLRRGIEEGIGDAIPAKVRNVLSFFNGHADHDCFEVRLHDTTLYNSIYRFDGEMLVNSHVWGLPAAHAPVFTIRQLPGGEMFDMYAECFDEIWNQAVPAWENLRKAG